MSPEQLGASPSIIERHFQRGAILYEMLTDGAPFLAKTESRHHDCGSARRNHPRWMSVKAWFHPLLTTSPAVWKREPENRFQSGKDLACALEALSGSSAGKRSLLLDSMRLTAKTLLATRGCASRLSSVSAGDTVAASATPTEVSAPDLRRGHTLFGAFAPTGSRALRRRMERQGPCSFTPRWQFSVGPAVGSDRR